MDRLDFSQLLVSAIIFIMLADLQSCDAHSIMGINAPLEYLLHFNFGRKGKVVVLDASGALWQLASNESMDQKLSAVPLDSSMNVKSSNIAH